MKDIDILLLLAALLCVGLSFPPLGNGDRRPGVEPISGPKVDAGGDRRAAVLHGFLQPGGLPLDHSGRQHSRQLRHF